MQHFHSKIQGWAAFAPLYMRMAKQARNGQRFVEVGSWLGKSAALMAVELENRGVNVELVCVDPWLDGGPDLKDTSYFKELGVNQVYDLFLQNMRPVLHRIKAMRMPSVEAARFLPDDSVDFIMLDGDHSYEAVRDDIAAWLPKMKDGAIMAGDDYTWPGVEQAVEEAFNPSEVTTVINSGNRRNKNYRLDSSYWWTTVGGRL